MSLNVKHLMLPAADEVESIWKNKFGFLKVNQDEVCILHEILLACMILQVMVKYAFQSTLSLQVFEYTKDSPVTTFQGTSMLHKLVPKCEVEGS